MDPSGALKVALLGCGRLGTEVFLPVIASTAGVQLTTVVDPDPAAASRARVTSPDVTWRHDWRELLDNPLPDAAIIALPSPMHAEAASALIDRGVPVYLEKPMATSTHDADALLSLYERRGVTVMLGHNYRANPLFERMAAQIAGGAVGRVEMIRTVFCSPMRTTGGWRADANSGGGALFDLGSHHLDLIRFLTGEEILEVDATMAPAPGDRISVNLALTGGVIATSIFAKDSADDDRVEVYGTSGVLSVDRYRSVAPVLRGRAVPGRGAAVRDALRSVTQARYLLRKMGEPWHEPSFRIAFGRFVSAVRDKRLITPDPRDGWAGVMALVAAERSASEGRRIRLPVRAVPAASPPVIAPERHEPTGVRPGEALISRERAGPALSAVILVRGGFDAVAPVTRQLATQALRAQIELVFVSPTPLGVPDDAVRGFWGHQVVLETDQSVSGPARAAGVQHSQADIVVFVEDHCYPTKGWAEALLRAHEQPWAVVGPAILNANPRTVLSWANLLIEYGPWLSPCERGACDHAPGHNSAYKRAVLVEYGDRLPAMLDAESVLHWDLRRRGLGVALEPDARNRHLNFARFVPSLAVRYFGGRLFASSRSRSWTIGQRVTYTAAAPLIPFVRFLRVRDQAKRLKDTRPRRGLLPLAFLLLVVDAIGEAAGYAFGIGSSGSKMRDLEFDRHRYLASGDQVPT